MLKHVAVALQNQEADKKLSWKNMVEIVMDQGVNLFLVFCLFAQVDILYSLVSKCAMESSK